MSMKNLVLVTGGAGFIGSHVTSHLLDQGYRVRVLDNLSTGSPDNLAGLPIDLMVGDIRDRNLCDRAMQGCAGVVHLAAMPAVGPSLAVPELCIQSNVVGTSNVALAAREQGVRGLVYAASSTYYGNNGAPNGLDQRANCLNPYALSKYQGELIIEHIQRFYGLPAMSLRFFNVYGSRQPRTGAYALVLGIFLERLACGKALELHGDGQQRRDFVHVRDVARAVEMALAKLLTGFEGYEVLNVGSGTNTSILELAQLLTSNMTFVDRRPGDAQATLADISRTEAVLGWRPEVPFEAGLQALVEGS